MIYSQFKIYYVDVGLNIIFALAIQLCSVHVWPIKQKVIFVYQSPFVF